MATKKTALYFTTVCAYPGNTAVMGGHLQLEGDDPSGTRLMLINNGSWGFVADVRDVVYSMLLRIPPGESKRRLVVLGREGLVREFLPGGAGYTDTHIPTDYGYLEDLREIDRSLYACGAQGQVFHFASGSWQAVDGGLRKPFDGENVERMLLSIDGFSPDSIYVCGFEGEVWHWNGRKWSRVDSPTNMPLQCVLCAPDGRAYFCGAGGGLYALAQDGSWDELSNTRVSKSTFWDMAIFNGRIYIAGDDRLLYLERDVLKAVSAPKDGKPRVLAIDASDERIWCVGEDDVFSFDGKNWARHICPENV
jgi:hypothetical protein